MASDTVELARRGYAAINERGADALAEFIDPEIQWEVISDAGPSLSFSGAAEVLEFAQVWFDPYNWLRLDPEEIIELEDDRVLVLVNQHGELTEGSAPLEQKIAHVLTFRNAKCVRLRGFARREDAFEELGLERP